MCALSLKRFRKTLSSSRSEKLLNYSGAIEQPFLTALRSVSSIAEVAAVVASIASYSFSDGNCFVGLFITDLLPWRFGLDKSYLGYKSNLSSFSGFLNLLASPQFDFYGLLISF